MEPSPTPPFGALLRRYRLAAGLSQEELAERAALSIEAIGALERGVRRAPYRATVEMLADALALAPDQRTQLHAAVSRRRGPPQPAAPSDAAIATLPAPSTSFVGREREQATVLRLLESSRLLTLTGTGGVGKTRLATQIAATLTADFADGVHMVELAAIVDAALVPRAAAQALGVREEPGRPLTDTLSEALRGRSVLLILDNCEHLRPAAAALAGDLLGAAPRLRILATSREALGIVGETVWRVPSLTLPAATRAGDAPAIHTASSVGRAEAVRLFVARAVAAFPGFALTDDYADAVAAICRRLDGIPLAIELAAARARILTPEQIAARLDERFRLLIGSSPDVPSRQQTLRAALDWSHDLLTEPERALLRRLSVFAGGCEVEAAEAVCVGDLPPGPLPEGRGSLREGPFGLQAVTTSSGQSDGESGSPSLQGGGRGVGHPPDLFTLLSSLADKSLVTVEYRAGAARYRLLESIRAYGEERLAGAGEGEAMRARHLGWCLAVAAEESRRVVGTEQAAAIAHLAGEIDNLRAALAFAAEFDGTAMAELATLLWRFWLLSGAASEGREWLSRALDHAPGGTVARARLLDVAGTLAHAQAAYDDARRAHEESLAIWRTLGDPGGIAGALSSLGVVHKAQGDLEAAAAPLEEALALWRETGDEARAAMVLNNLAAVATDRGDLSAADRHQEESLALKRRSGDRPGIAASLHNLAESACRRGEFQRADALITESLELSRGLGLTPYVAQSLHSAGVIACRLGDQGRAVAFLRESLTLFRELGIGLGTPLCLEALAGVAVARGQHRDAARLLGAAAAQRDLLDAPLPPSERDDHDCILAGCRAALGRDALAAALIAGGAMTADEAVSSARDVMEARS